MNNFVTFHKFMFIWMKNFIEIFLVKTYEWDFSYGTKMIQLIHIQYT
jgi:hypothetical protein